MNTERDPAIRYYTGNLPSEQFAVGDRLGNGRFVNARGESDPRYPHETFVVTKVVGEYVFTRNEYSGSEGVMMRDFYARNFRRLPPKSAVVSP